MNTDLIKALTTLKHATEKDIDEVLEPLSAEEITSLLSSVQYLYEYIREVELTTSNKPVPHVNEAIEDYLVFVKDAITKAVTEKLDQFDVDIDNVNEILDDYAGENYQEVIDYFESRKREWLPFDADRVGWNFVGYKEGYKQEYQCSKCGTYVTGEDIEFEKPNKCPVCGSSMINGDVEWTDDVSYAEAEME